MICTSLALMTSSRTRAIKRKKSRLPHGDTEKMKEELTAAHQWQQFPPYALKHILNHDKCSQRTTSFNSFVTFFPLQWPCTGSPLYTTSPSRVRPGKHPRPPVTRPCTRTARRMFNPKPRPPPPPSAQRHGRWQWWWWWGPGHGVHGTGHQRKPEFGLLGQPRPCSPPPFPCCLQH